jgi:hypothetical protein
VFRELHGYSGKLRGVEVEAEGAPTYLSMVARRQWRTMAWRGGDLTIGNRGKWVRSVRHGEEGEVEGLTGGSEFCSEGGGGTVHNQRGKVKMRPTHYDSGDEVGWGSTGEILCFR